MASPEQATASRPKRPAPMTRQSSSQSHISQSPSEKGHHRPQQHKVTHRHVAGGRMQRTMSAGKNLGKFNKAAQQQPPPQSQPQTPQAEEGRHHRRSQSGASLSAPSSPRPGFKRNASSGAIMRHNPQAHAGGLRKNHSSGHLVGKAKGGKSSKDLALMKAKLGNPARSRQASPEERPIVHFDVGDEAGEEEEEEGGWTEESASQSPNTTRSNTRSNSVAAEAQRVVDDATESNTRANAGDTSPALPPQAQALPDRTRAPPPASRAASSTHSRPPDADLITSRLLQRSASHTVVAPQSSSVSATVASTAGRGHQLSTSVGSTLVDTPGRDLVSRFMDGDGSAGTPHDGSYMPGRRVSKENEGALDKSKRNRSMPNFGDTDDADGADTPTRPQSVKSGATTPNLFPPINNRTQNKLLLQRAASAIEPHAPVPAILRTGGPSFHNIGLSYPGEGRLDPRLQQQFNHVAIEYKVIQRYRNPLADSILRVQQMPGMLRKLRATRPTSTNGASGLGFSTLSSSINEAPDTDGAGSRRSRSSFEHDEGAASAEERPRNEAEELCRRMWDSAEIVGGD
ncbi:hypothetical protein C7974DRAFT_413077 [Boeremia exigua]|uniref:uncharacterized protein n=1 Tax=Boeremia exigua TaxID=749465 RepID=UPI001E8D3A27|nr:uncharacterized protein C7974DRAFT_413077 [Boeremia exigua]KAH6629266.1 hypothetical protein C7974DRAFT_413077 [Boeremia exigua]